MAGEVEGTMEEGEIWEAPARGAPRAAGRRRRMIGARFTDLVRLVARVAPGIVGSTAAFIGVVVVTLAWVAVGPVFGFSDGWLLVPSAVASIVALLLVVLLQYSQNRDTRALQLKLDEVIRAVGEARTDLLRLERLSDEELKQIETEFDRLRDEDYP
jgi:low affinity Fe/Cu permease